MGARGLSGQKRRKEPTRGGGQAAHPPEQGPRLSRGRRHLGSGRDGNLPEAVTFHLRKQPPLLLRATQVSSRLAFAESSRTSPGRPSFSVPGAGNR